MVCKGKLEQLERLHSEDTPRRLMITHTIKSYWIPTQKKTKSKLQIWRIRQNFKFLILKQTLHATHLLKLLDKMCKYEMDPMSIVEDTEWTRFCPQTDRHTDGQGETSIPPFNFVEVGGIKRYETKNSSYSPWKFEEIYQNPEYHFYPALSL